MCLNCSNNYYLVADLSLKETEDLHWKKYTDFMLLFRLVNAENLKQL